MISFVLMHLVDLQLVQLDDDVNMHLCDFALRNPHFPHVPITLRMLLSHTASIDVGRRTAY